MESVHKMLSIGAATNHHNLGGPTLKLPARLKSVLSYFYCFLIPEIVILRWRVEGSMNIGMVIILTASIILHVATLHLSILYDLIIWIKRLHANLPHHYPLHDRFLSPTRCVFGA
jgi:hypothetical protein